MTYCFLRSAAGRNQEHNPLTVGVCRVQKYNWDLACSWLRGSKKAQITQGLWNQTAWLVTVLLYVGFVLASKLLGYF